MKVRVIFKIFLPRTCGVVSSDLMEWSLLIGRKQKMRTCKPEVKVIPRLNGGHSNLQTPLM